MTEGSTGKGRCSAPPDRTCSPTSPPRCGSIRRTSPAARRRTGGCSPPGSPPGSEFLWEFHYQVYWDLTQRIYREEFDPSYDGSTEAGTPYCRSGEPNCDADYDYFSRPRSVRHAVANVQLSGRIGKPLLTLHGTLDTLLPPATDSDVYTRLVRSRHRGALHRYYVVADGTHVDSLYEAYPTRLRPILPCYRDALESLDRWVTAGAPPPPSRTIPRPLAGDLANTCD